MKKSILLAGMLAMVAFTACNNAKTEETKSETPATTQSTGSTTVDLSDKGVDGMDLTIVVPDSLKLTYTKSDYTGTLDATGAGNYKMQITSNYANEERSIEDNLKEQMSTVIHNLDTLVSKFLVREPNYIIWENKNDAGTTVYHFFGVIGANKSTFYSFSDDEKTVHSEAAARSMYAIAKSAVIKPAKPVEE